MDLNSWALRQDRKGRGGVGAHPMSVLSEGSVARAPHPHPETIASRAWGLISAMSFSSPDRLLGGDYDLSPVDSRTPHTLTSSPSQAAPRDPQTQAGLTGDLN